MNLILYLLSVMQVRATDPDRGANGNISYSVVKSGDQSSEWFAIDLVSGKSSEWVALIQSQVNSVNGMHPSSLR